MTTISRIKLLLLITINGKISVLFTIVNISHDKTMDKAKGKTVNFTNVPKEMHTTHAKLLVMKFFFLKTFTKKNIPEIERKFAKLS